MSTSARSRTPWSSFGGCRLSQEHTRVRYSSREVQPGYPKGVEPLPPGSQPGMQRPLHHGHHNPHITKIFIPSSPTRIRTRNTSLEPRHDFRFTIEPMRKAWDLNPHGGEAARFSKPARRAVSGYLPYSVDPPRIELGFPPRQGGVVPLDHEPIHRSGPAGESNPDLLGANEASSRWTSRPFVSQRSVWELNPVFRPTKAACSLSTYRPK